jgi:hypothetical protein
VTVASTLQQGHHGMVTGESEISSSQLACCYQAGPGCRGGAAPSRLESLEGPRHRDLAAAASAAWTVTVSAAVAAAQARRDFRVVGLRLQVNRMARVQTESPMPQTLDDDPASRWPGRRTGPQTARPADGRISNLPVRVARLGPRPGARPPSQPSHWQPAAAKAQCRMMAAAY